MESPKKYKLEDISECVEIDKHHQAACDNLGLRMKINNKKKNINELYRELDEAKIENQRLREDVSRLEEEKYEDPEELEANAHQFEFYRKLNQNIDQMKSNLQSIRSPIRFIFSKSFVVTVIEAILIFFIVALLSSATLSSNRKY
jgi:predicted  nucleic acid-binding Zn-ribbon protein